ncbi:MAG: argininosuccinate lyase [Firmicutes bacterium]|jgi:argininosuccinate lyase|nr:argininosuccinate lyase [Bacillota bacterium]
MTLWSGRINVEPAKEMMDFSVSLSYDKRLAKDDIHGSKAHVQGLLFAGILDNSEASGLVGALEQVERELDEGAFSFVAADEDIHTAIERRVTEILGDVGAKLHTGRSRNDQVATALRLYTKRETKELIKGLLLLQECLLQRAKEAGAAYLPGYTHMQRAQPVLLSHQLLAHGWAFARDVDRIFHDIRRMDVSPLGAGALAGSSLPLNPELTAKELGFRTMFDNSLDAVSDRDFVAETLFCCSMAAVHLSRLGEEVVLFSSGEFGFYKLDDAFSTGSSMLPQKKNPDIAELARGKTGRLIGNLTGFLATLKGLPLAYNRDLQEDKEPLFDTIDQLKSALPAMTGLLSNMTFDFERMAAAADSPEMAAIDLAEWLVERKIPFRQAHTIVGEIVRESLGRGVDMAELVAAHPDLGPEAVHILEPGVAVQRRITPGGAGVKSVKKQLSDFEERLSADFNLLDKIDIQD